MEALKPWSPPIDARYWVALFMSSVFGTNTGDFAAESLGLGHVTGLFWLAGLLAVMFGAARLTRHASPFLFWAAIIVVRTAATNVGDIFGDYHIAFAVSLSLTVLIYAVCIPLYARGAAGRGIVVDWSYWGMMMLAGIIGTIGGDATSFGLGLWPPGTLAVCGALSLAAIVLTGRRGLWLVPVVYWPVVALVRTAGTGGGDSMSALCGTVMRGLGIGNLDVPFYVAGLPPATIITGLIFVTLIWVFYGSPGSQRHIGVARPRAE